MLQKRRNNILVVVLIVAVVVGRLLPLLHPEFVGGGRVVDAGTVELGRLGTLEPERQEREEHHVHDHEATEHEEFRGLEQGQDGVVFVRSGYLI